MDRGAWWATVCGVAKSQTQLRQVRMHAHINMHDTWMCLCVYLYMYSHVCSVTYVLSHFSHVWLFAVFKLEGNERESCRVNKREQWWEAALHPAFLWGCVWNQGSESNAPNEEHSSESWCAKWTVLLNILETSMQISTDGRARKGASTGRTYMVKVERQWPAWIFLSF